MLKSIAEEICSHFETAIAANKNMFGITNKVLGEFKVSLPWLDHYVYSHFIKCNKLLQIITTNPEEFQQISSVESAQNTASVSDTQKKKNKSSQPKGSTNKNQAAAASWIALAKNYAAIEFDKLKSESCEMKKCVRKGAYDAVVKNPINLPYLMMWQSVKYQFSITWNWITSFLLPTLDHPHQWWKWNPFCWTCCCSWVIWIHLWCVEKG